MKAPSDIPVARSASEIAWTDCRRQIRNTSPLRAVPSWDDLRRARQLAVARGALGSKGRGNTGDGVETIEGEAREIVLLKKSDGLTQTGK